MPSCIYLLTNTINQKQYIGFTTKTLEERCDGHLKSVKDGSQFHIHRSIRKNGWSNFTAEIIYMSEDAHHCKNEAEVALIASYNTRYGPGYNMTEGGDGSLGRITTDETKAKMVKAWESRSPTTDETKAKLSLAGKGRIFTIETRARISTALKGHIVTDETKRKIGEKAKGRKPSDETKAKMSKAGKERIFTDEHKLNISKAKTKHVTPAADELGDMLKFFTRLQTAKYYGVSIQTVARWKIIYRDYNFVYR